MQDPPDPFTQSTSSVSRSGFGPLMLGISVERITNPASPHPPRCCVTRRVNVKGSASNVQGASSRLLLTEENGLVCGPRMGCMTFAEPCVRREDRRWKDQFRIWHEIVPTLTFSPLLTCSPRTGNIGPVVILQTCTITDRTGGDVLSG